MGYVETNCRAPNEKITLRVRKSGFFLFWKWVWGVLGCWLLLIPTISAIKETVIFKTTEYVITDKKVVEKYGCFSIQCDQMGIEKVENVTTQVSFWGRIFNFGDVVIQGTNRNNIYFNDVRNAEQIRNEINKLIFSGEKDEISY